MKKGIKIGVITLLLLLTGCTIGGSFFMLNYSLRPEAKIRAKNADSYPFMYKNYPFLRPWVDSLNQAHAQCTIARPSTSGGEWWSRHPDGLERPPGRNAMDAHRQPDLRGQYPNGSTRYFNGRSYHHDGFGRGTTLFCKMFR